MREPIRKLDVHGDNGPQRPARLVVAALILRGADRNSNFDSNSNSDGRPPAQEVLICQRKPDQPMSLKWEFPGGKVEAGETSEQALARELEEELGIQATIGRKVTRIRHKYRNGGSIDLQFFIIDEFSGAIENRIFNDVRWSPLDRLPDYDFLAADLGLIRDLAVGKLL